METVRFIIKFEDFANSTIPYMYHCHLLTHEDDGMMGQFLVTSPTDVKKEISALPNSITLDQNYPNPFNPSTMISYQISKGGNVSLKIFDVLGNEVLTLVNKEQVAGRYTINFN